MKIFGKELKFNGFDIWHRGNFNPDDKSDTTHNHSVLPQNVTFGNGNNFSIDQTGGTWKQKLGTADTTDLNTHRLTFQEDQGVGTYTELFGVDGYGDIYGKGVKVSKVDHTHDYAPGGYGLGGLCRNVTGDWNSYVDTGFYMGLSLTNSPPATNGSNTWWYVIIMTHNTSSGWTLQIATDFNNKATYRRAKVNGVWSAWTLLYTSDNKPTPADIGALASNANAVSASKWATARTINLGGDLSGSAPIDGSGDVTINATVKDDSHNHVISNVDNLQTTLDGISKTVTATLAATAGWYRVAQSAVDIVRCSGRFEIDWMLSGVHGQVIFNGAIMYGKSVTMNQVLFSTYDATKGLTKARIVYHSTYSGNYAYLEVYNASASAITVTATGLGLMGWTMLTPSTVGGVPTGYSTTEISFIEGISTEGQIKSSVSTGTAPLVVSSTTNILNLNADFLDGLHATSFMRSISANGYYGMARASDGDSTDWIRTTVNGILPYASGGASALGTSSWPFNNAYVKNIYENGTLLSNKYAPKSHTHAKAEITDMPTKLSEFLNDIGAGGGIKITTSPMAPTTTSPGDFWYKEV